MSERSCVISSFQTNESIEKMNEEERKELNNERLNFLKRKNETVNPKIEYYKSLGYLS